MYHRVVPACLTKLLYYNIFLRFTAPWWIFASLTTIDLETVSPRARRKIRTAHKSAADPILKGFTRLRFISSINTNVNKLKTYRPTSFQSNRIKHYACPTTSTVITAYYLPTFNSRRKILIQYFYLLQSSRVLLPLNPSFEILIAAVQRAGLYGSWA